MWGVRSGRTRCDAQGFQSVNDLVIRVTPRELEGAHSARSGVLYVTEGGERLRQLEKRGRGLIRERRTGDQALEARFRGANEGAVADGGGRDRQAAERWENDTSHRLTVERRCEPSDGRVGPSALQKDL